MSEDSKGKNYFDLKSLLLLLKENSGLLLGWMIMGLVISVIISVFFVTPKYKSSIDILVNQKDQNTETQFNVQQADLQAINTYKDILKKSIVLSPVLKHAKQEDNYLGTITDLENAISISNENESQVITVSVVDSNAYTAKDIANFIGATFTKKIKNMMKIDNVTIVSQAKLHTKPISPNKPLYAGIGLLSGLIIGLLIVLIKKVFDNKVRSVDFLNDELELTNLGVVFHMHDKNNFHEVTVSKTDERKSRRV